MTLSQRDMQAVAAVIENTVRCQAMRRFRNLGKADISTNRRGDLVTTADRAIEEDIGTFLTRMFPGSATIGEENTADDPGLLPRLGSGAAWLIDPIDGTSSFAAGSPRFSTLVALCIAGRAIASWVHAPVAGIMMTAQAGNGTHMNGHRLELEKIPAGPIRAAVTNPRYQTPDDRVQIARLHSAGIATSPCDSVGLEYIALSAGKTRAGVFGWDNSWDHAAGLLAHTEARGVHTTASGDAFQLTGGNQLPLLVAADKDLLTRLRAVIAG